MSSKKKVFKVLALAAGLALASHAALAADRKIVILQALTGGAAFVGVPASDGMKFAADELNAKIFWVLTRSSMKWPTALRHALRQWPQ